MKPIISALILFAVSLGAAGVQAQSIQVEGALARDHVVAPGEIVQDVLTVTNVGSAPVQVKSYLSDYSYRLDQSNYDAPGTMPRSNAAWITVAPSLLSLAAGQRAQIIVQTRVPADGHQEGSYWSIVMVEPQTQVAALAPEQGKTVLGVQSVFRYGIQILTTIGRTGVAEVKFAGCVCVKQGTAGQSRRQLQVDLENVGTQALRPLVWAELHDTDGVLVKRVESHKARLYPGCLQRYELDVTDVAPGRYTVLAVADNGDENIFGARYELDLR